MDKTYLKNLLRYPISRKARNYIRQKNSAIRLFMTLLVKNEEEIIEQNIRFHHAMGVDGFIVALHNCEDRTEEILLKLQQEGINIKIIHRGGFKYQQKVWVNEMVHLAKRDCRATWVINADADEFYYSIYLDLKESIRRNTGNNALVVDSLFLFPDERADFLHNTHFVTRPFQRFEAEKLHIIDNLLYQDFIGSQGCTKVIHKTDGFLSVTPGNHDVKIKKRVIAHTADIRLYHYHIRNYRGWEEKIKRYVDTVFMSKNQGVHMQEMITLYKEGKLRKTFDEKYGTSVLTFLEEKGVVTLDPSVSNFLKYKNIE